MRTGSNSAEACTQQKTFGSVKKPPKTTDAVTQTCKTAKKSDNVAVSHAQISIKSADTKPVESAVKTQPPYKLTEKPTATTAKKRDSSAADKKPAMDALYKKAVGYNVSESVEEYVSLPEEGGLVLSKKKITKKHIPPDISALKLLLDIQSQNDLSHMSDEQLAAEKQRLTSMLCNMDE